MKPLTKTPGSNLLDVTGKSRFTPILDDMRSFYKAKLTLIDEMTELCKNPTNISNQPVNRNLKFDQ